MFARNRLFACASASAVSRADRNSAAARSDSDNRAATRSRSRARHRTSPKRRANPATAAAPAAAAPDAEGPPRPRSPTDARRSPSRRATQQRTTIEPSASSAPAAVRIVGGCRVNVPHLRKSATAAGPPLRPVTGVRQPLVSDGSADISRPGRGKAAPPKRPRGTRSLPGTAGGRRGAMASCVSRHHCDRVFHVAAASSGQEEAWLDGRNTDPWDVMGSAGRRWGHVGGAGQGAGGT